MAVRADYAAILAPEDVAALLVDPVLQTAVAGQLLTPTRTSGRQYRIPIVKTDPSAAWVNEGEEIPIVEGEVDEVEVLPRKLAGLNVISRELANDSSPDAGKVIGDGLARDISRKLDAALFAATTAKGPSGLPSLTGIVAATAATMAAVVDTLIGVTYTLEANHASPTNWVAHPDTAARISSLKKATGSNEPLLGNDISVPGKRTLLGTPLLTSPYVAANVVWGVDKTFSRLVVWEDAEVESDKSAFFTSDRIAVRATMRGGFAFTHPGSVAKVTLPAAS